MVFIKEYIDFSIKYKYLVGNKLPIEIKRYIWEHYRILVAIDKIRKYSEMYKKKCEDCGLMKNAIFLKRVPACSENYVDNYNCCWKTICRNGCKMELDCGCIKHFRPYQQVNKINKIECCGKKNKIEFTWWGMSIDDYLYRY